MKVGIISIFDNNNHGNRLQNYALQQVLLRYADQVVTIKNKPFYGKANRLVRMLPIAENVLFNRLLGKRRRARIVAFTNKHVTTGKGCYWYDRGNVTLKEADRCDLYCAGSDQVWNPTMGRGGNLDYLGFAPSEVTFSYAASFGLDELPVQACPAARDGIQHIRSLSVREDAGAEIVRDLTGRTDVQVLVDPTLLLTVEEWDRILTMPKAPVPQNYVLAYYVGQLSEERRQRLAEHAYHMGCELIDVMDPESPFYALGPDELVWLIKHARLVCTDSFHGSVFSFLYRKPLAIFVRQGKGPDMGSRLRTLVSKFSLEACVAVEDVLPEYDPQPDYSAGYAALAAEREKSKAFLDRVFEEYKG